MKVIIAGATGYIGQEILTQCIAHPSITSIVALTRRDLDIKNDKLRTYLMKDEDFLSYSDPKLRDELKNASACLWSIGLRPSQAGNDERTRVISVDYPAAAAANMAEIASTSAPGRKLRFVYISGSGVERDQNKSLWWMGNFRRLRGESENVLLRHAEANPDAFEAYIMRPSLVPSTQGMIRDRVWSMFPSVRMDLLARAMVDIALNGNEETTIENQTINEWP